MASPLRPRREAASMPQSASSFPPSSPSSMQPPLQLRIGTLSLPGASPAHAARIGDAMRSELALLLRSAAGGFDTSQHHARIDAGTLRVAPTDRPEAIGRRLARTIAGSLHHARSDTPGDDS